MSEVDKFVQEKVLAQYHEIVHNFRSLIQEEFPLIEEGIRWWTKDYYWVPVYKYKRIIITLSPTKKWITFSFTEWKKIKDKYNLLEGTWKKTLNLRINSLLDKHIMIYYIRQAIELDDY